MVACQFEFLPKKKLKKKKREPSSPSFLLFHALPLHVRHGMLTTQTVVSYLPVFLFSVFLKPLRQSALLWSTFSCSDLTLSVQ